MKMKIGFIGAGRMAESLVKSLPDSGLAKETDIYVSDVKEERLTELKDKLKINLALSNKGIFKNCDTVFLSVKPQNMQEVLNDIKDEVSEKHLIITIAAGIKLKTVESKLGKARIVRVMPNSACLVGEGMSAFCMGKNASDSDKEIVEKFLGSCGKCIEVKEEMMDVITALSGSGPGFFAELLQYFAEAGAKNGLSNEDSYALARQTLYGTGKLLTSQDLMPFELVEMVASKRGTTDAGLQVLRKSGVREAIIKTIGAAVKRSKELGK